MAASVTYNLMDGLSKTNQNFLPGKFKVWCYQFTLYQDGLMWPLKLCNITLTAVEKMDYKAKCYIHKWLGLLQCLSNMALFGRNTLQFPLKSTSLGYKQEKARFLMKLRDSTDPTVQNSKVQVRSGQKWNEAKVVDQVINRLKHQEIVGWLQTGRAGLGWGKLWSKAKKGEVEPGDRRG